VSGVLSLRQPLNIFTFSSSLYIFYAGQETFLKRISLIFFKSFLKEFSKKTEKRVKKGEKLEKPEKRGKRNVRERERRLVC